MDRMKTTGVALVTGSSIGIGFETSLALARDGIHTFATMRDDQKGGAIKNIANEEGLPLEVLKMDVDDKDSVRKTVLEIIDRTKRIDILVNNAGCGLFGALEDISLEEIKEQFETNYFGAIRTIKEVLSTMRKQKKGIIVNVSSIAGVVGIPGECAYSSSKFALEGLSESISYELQPFGIKVILIEPGVVNTNFVPSIRYPKKAQYKSAEEAERERGNNAYQSHYSGTIDAFLPRYYSAMKNAPSPSLVSAVIIEAINNASQSSQCLFRYTVGDDSGSLALAKRYMSDTQLCSYITEKLLK
jgi:NAD(P)-dependent dehydrogenase (short-subunit alcohol dehydrogenase family)